MDSNQTFSETRPELNDKEEIRDITKSYGEHLNIRHTGKAGRMVWTLRLWTLGLWATGGLDYGQLHSRRLDALPLDAWITV